MGVPYIEVRFLFLHIFVASRIFPHFLHSLETSLPWMICVLAFLQYNRLLILLPLLSYSYTVQLGSITEKDRNVMKLCLKLKNIHELGFCSAVWGSCIKTDCVYHSVRCNFIYLFFISLKAPCEAEASCAALVKGGKVFATATEDMDGLTFGTNILLRHLTASEAKYEPASPLTEILAEWKWLKAVALILHQIYVYHMNICVYEMV